MPYESNSVVYDIAKDISDYMKLALEEFVQQNDETRAGLVRVGLLQQSPVTAGINILIQENDPEDEKSWKHSVVEATPSGSLGMQMPAYQVGGGGFWWRRYTLQLTQFFRIGNGRAAAEELSSIILSRAEKAVREAALPEDMDSFGEVAIKTFISHSTNIESGGVGQFIFHGRIYFQVLTEKTLY